MCGKIRFFCVTERNDILRGRYTGALRHKVEGFVFNFISPWMPDYYRLYSYSAALEGSETVSGDKQLLQGVNYLMCSIYFWKNVFSIQKPFYFVTPYIDSISQKILKDLFTRGEFPRKRKGRCKVKLKWIRIPFYGGRWFARWLDV